MHKMDLICLEFPVKLDAIAIAHLPMHCHCIATAIKLASFFGVIIDCECIGTAAVQIV